jgi:cation diffusion facilitator family transporter
MLVANGRNMRNDILISLGVLIGLVCTLLLKQPLIDRFLALLISLFIMYSAFRIFMKTNIDLMDGIDDPGLYDQLFEAVKKVDGAYHPHRVRARKIGYRYMVNLDIEVHPFLSVREAHEIANQVEKNIKADLNDVYDVMVHVEPLGNNEEGEKYGISESEIHKMNNGNDH